MLPSAPVKLVDLFVLASAGSVTVGTAWFVVRLAKAIVPSVVGYLSRPQSESPTRIIPAA
jgi:hypothetical protein